MQKVGFILILLVFFLLSGCDDPGDEWYSLSFSPGSRQVIPVVSNHRRSTLVVARVMVRDGPLVLTFIDPVGHRSMACFEPSGEVQFLKKKLPGMSGRWRIAVTSNSGSGDVQILNGDAGFSP